MTLDTVYANPSDAAPGQEPDERLMQRARNGDAAAFAQLLGRHQDSLWRYLLHGCQEEAVAGRMFRDICSQVVHSLRRCELPGRFRPWLYGLAFHHLLDYHRLRCLATAPAEEWSAPSETDGAAPAYRAVAALSVAHRALFLLEAEPQLPPEEMAAAVGGGRHGLRRRREEMREHLQAELLALGGPAAGLAPADAMAAYRQRARELAPPGVINPVLQQAQTRLSVPVEAELAGFRGTRWRFALAALLVLSFCVLLVLQQDPRAVQETLAKLPLPPPTLTSSPPLIAESLHAPSRSGANSAPAAAAPSIAEIRAWIAAGDERRARDALAAWQRAHPDRPLPDDLARWAAAAAPASVEDRP